MLRHNIVEQLLDGSSRTQVATMNTDFDPPVRSLKLVSEQTSIVSALRGVVMESQLDPLLSQLPRTVCTQTLVGPSSNESHFSLQ